jgi:hypothetical protein
MPVKLREQYNLPMDSVQKDECIKFETEITEFYTACLTYLEKWLTPLIEFKCFEWMTLENEPEWEEVIKPVIYINNKTISIDDEKCFDELLKLKSFVKAIKIENEFMCMFADEKSPKYFNQSRAHDFHSEFLILAHFFVAIPAHNANVERIFSLMYT